MAGSISVLLVRAPGPRQVEQRALRLPAGSTLGQALAAAGWPASPTFGVDTCVDALRPAAPAPWSDCGIQDAAMKIGNAAMANSRLTFDLRADIGTSFVPGKGRPG